MTIGELNTKIVIKHYATVQNIDTGKLETILTASWGKWAKVEQTSGSRALDNATITYKESFTITIRYEASRPTLTNYKLAYRDSDLIIHSVVREFEGKAWWETITAYTQK